MTDVILQELPPEVVAHFRDLKTISNISSRVCVTVFDSVFETRERYIADALELLRTFACDRCIVFLDPDTGLEPHKSGLEHVRNDEAAKIWGNMKAGDVFVFYQHQTNRAGQPWIEPKKNQLARALGVLPDEILVAHAPKIANDVVFFYVQKG